MRVLILSNSYAPRIGGLETAVSSLAKQWQTGGHIVEVVTQRYPRHLAIQEEIDGVKVSRRMFLTAAWEQLPRKRADLFLGGLYYQCASQYWLEEKICAFAPHVINIHFPDSQIPFVLKAQKKIPFKLVVSLHGHDVERWFEKEHQNKASAQYIQLESLINQASAITTCSKDLLQKAIQLFPFVKDKGYAVPNGINIKRFENQQAHEHPQKYYFAYGRLTHKKGFDLLIQSFHDHIKKHIDVDLVIAGEGEEKQKLEQMREKMNMTKKIHFLGQASQKKVVELLNGCHGVIIPSRIEPFGIVALEALAAGKPIVATHVGGLVEILEGSQNKLVEPSVEGLVGGLSWLQNAMNEKIIAKENKRIANKYSWGESARKYICVFQDIL